MPQGTMPKPKEFRVREKEALKTSLMDYLEGNEYQWLREHWIPKLLEMAGTELPAIGIAMNIAGTLVALEKEGSRMKEKPLKRDSLDKILVTELFSLFFESKELAEKAWKQLPPSIPGNLEASAGRAFSTLAPMLCEVIITSGDSNTAGGWEEELKFKGSSTVGGSSSCGPAWSGPSTAPWDQPPSFPSLNSTSFGIGHHSEDEGSSTSSRPSSRPKQEGSSTVDGSSSCGPPWSGPSTAPWDQPPSFPSLNSTSFGIEHHSEDEESSTSSRPKQEGSSTVDGSSPWGPRWSGPSTAPFGQPPSWPSNNTSFGIMHYSEDDESNTSSRPKQEGPNTVDGSSPRGPPGAGPSTALYGQPPSWPSNNTSFGIAHSSSSEESSIFSLSKYEGQHKVYPCQPYGRRGLDLVPSTASSLPLICTHPSQCDLPTPFANIASSTSPGVSSYADTEQPKDDRSGTSIRSKDFWANFGLEMDGPELREDGVVFQTSRHFTPRSSQKE